MIYGTSASVVASRSGFGRLEAPFYPKMKLDDRANTSLVSDRDYYLFKPNTIYIPFALNPDRPSLEKR